MPNVAERDINKLIKSSYKPFDTVDGFSIYSTSGGEVGFVKFEDSPTLREYVLEVKPNRGFVPKSGLIISRYIEGRVAGKRVLDMCTGETGVIAIHSAVSGAKAVLGVDVDKDTVNWARHNSKLNGLTNIKWQVNNLFAGLEENKFDIIVSNPPQMPMEKGPVHDWGGINGRDFIETIIKESPRFLSESGELCILIFDFLGVDKSYGNVAPLQSIFDENGFIMEIVAREKRKIRKGGQTEKSLAFILREYPNYNFQSDENSLSHEVLIIKATLGGQRYE